MYINSINALRKGFERKFSENMTKRMIVLLVGMVFLVATIMMTIKVIRERNEELQEKISYYQEIETYEKEWIMTNQAKNGMITTYEKKVQPDNWVNPYFANLAACALLEGSPSKEQKESVEKYLSWYLENMNSAENDPVNGEGTIYDYEIDISASGREKSISKNSYDSVDSYASTFLITAAAYVQKTKDIDWLKRNSSKLQKIANALWRCMNAKGISFAKADYPIYYLMDNCETNAGLRAMEELQKQGAAFAQGDEVKRYLEKNSECIEKEFWRKEEYVIGVDEGGHVLSENNRLSIYPKTIAQIYPIAWRLLDKDEKRSIKIYQNLCNDWKWEQMDYREQGNSQSYWPILAFVGAIIGDEDRVEKYVENYMEVAREDHGYPIHIDDAAWMIKTCEEMKSYYQEKIFTLF